MENGKCETSAIQEKDTAVIYNTYSVFLQFRVHVSVLEKYRHMWLDFQLPGTIAYFIFQQILNIKDTVVSWCLSTWMPDSKHKHSSLI